MTAASTAMARFEALLSPPGRELLDRLASMRTAGTAEADGVAGAAKASGATGTARAGGATGGTGADNVFGLGAALRAEYPAELVATALTQYELRLLARAKFTRAEHMFFTRPGLEQASPEPVARHRARRYAAARRAADLCTGVGGDLIALGASVPVLAVDLDPLHLRMAELNVAAYGAGERVRTLEADVRSADLAGIDAVFIDPARRTAGRRLPAGACEPPLSWCFGVADTVAAVGVKAAPGIPHRMVPDGWEIEFVAVGRDLKEAVLWSPALATAGRRATVLPTGDALVRAGARTEPGPAVEVKAPGAYVLDPNPAVTRAGLVEDLADRVDAWKIDDQIGFLSTDHQVRTPFARTLRVIESLPWHHKRLAQRLQALDIGAVDIRRRGLAGDVQLLRRRLKLRGTGQATLVMTRVRDKPWALVCADL